jgi:polyisoprenoid-binding protein YceI
VIATLLLAAIVAQPTTYRVDPKKAEAGFDLKATLHTVHGTTAQVSGEIHAVPEDGGGLALHGRIEVDAASLDTGNGKRDATLHGTSLEAPRYPKIVLEPERFLPSDPPAADGSVRGKLTGRLTIRGTSEPVTIEATLTPQGTALIAAGTFDVTWAHFGIPDPSFLFVHIEPVAHARFRVTFLPGS